MKLLANNENGLTLIELLATLVLMSIIGSLAFSLLFQGYSNYQRVNAESELRDEADIIMSTVIKDMFSAKSSEVRLVNSCSADGYSITHLSILKKNIPEQKIVFKASSGTEGEGIVTIDNVPVSFSDDVSLALYPCSPSDPAQPFNITTDDQLSYTVKFQLAVDKNSVEHYMEFENTFNLINN